MTRLMFAYGSNLNVEQMRLRCPDAEPLGRIKLPGWRLVFRGVADCVQEGGSHCWGGVWKITDECEVALDIYEGIASGLYRKEHIPIKRTPDGHTEMMIYVMNSAGIFPPSQHYLDIILDGYRDHRMPRSAHKTLREAVEESWDDKDPTHIERRRHLRHGRPRLAINPRLAA